MKNNNFNHQKLQIILYSSMSSKILKSQKAKRSIVSSNTASLSYISKKDLKHLQTFYNVSYTDYCGLSLMNRFKTEGNQSKTSLTNKRKNNDFWKRSKKCQLTLQRGDSLRVQPVKIYNSPRNRQERIKTQYSQSKIFKNYQAKIFVDYWKAYEVEFLQKKMVSFEAQGHKLKIAKFNEIKQKQRKGVFRPNTAYIKRVNPHINEDVRKIKTIDFKDKGIKDQSFYAISGWDSQIPLHQA